MSTIYKKKLNRKSQPVIYLDLAFSRFPSAFMITFFKAFLFFARIHFLSKFLQDSAQSDRKPLQ